MANEPNSLIESPLRILHLEDNAPDRELIATALTEGGLDCRFVHADNKIPFETALEAGGFDVIISDFTLPSFDGMAALGIARKLQPETPFLFVSGTIGEELAVDSLKSGAIDYVLKDHLPRLVPAVLRAVRDARERQEHKKLEAQLRQAQKMEAIGQLAGGVAHDFNNMLAIIRGNVEIVLLDGAGFNDETRQCLNHIIVASERAADLTRQLLAFGRKQVLEAKSVNLNEVLGDLAKMLKRIIGGNIQFDYTAATAQLFVEADVGMMEQVLLNLVVNARDAMPQGGSLQIRTDKVRLTAADAHTSTEARAGEFALLEVTDTGSGIAAEHLPHIFEPLFTTKDPGKGTGLGLSTVHGIVKQHRGWIDVSTRVNEGTSFKIFLPAIPPPSALLEVAASKMTAHGRGERILLVEDNPELRVVTKRILESHDYEVSAATSGQAALELVGNKNDFDLLVADVVMPDGISGRELADWLQAQKPALKIILVSGYSRDVAGKDSSASRSNKWRFLQKPYSSPNLLQTVRQSLDEGGKQASRD